MTAYKIYGWITILIWAMAYIFTKAGLHYYSPIGLSVFRYLAASAFLLGVILVKKIAPPDKKDLLWFFLSGATGFTIYVVAFNLGAGSVSVATASIIIATTPVITALAARTVFGERIKPLEWCGIVVEFIGVIVICSWQGIFTLRVGVLWILLAALSFSVYNIVLRKLNHKYTPIQITAYSIFAGTILLLFFLPGTLSELRHSVWQANISVIVLGVICSGIGYLLWSKALALAERTSEVTNYLFLSPFLTTVLGVVLLYEIPGISTWIGGAIIMAGMVLFEKGKKKQCGKVS